MADDHDDFEPDPTKVNRELYEQVNASEVAVYKYELDMLCAKGALSPETNVMQQVVRFSVGETEFGGHFIAKLLAFFKDVKLVLEEEYEKLFEVCTVGKLRSLLDMALEYFAQHSKQDAKVH